MDEDEEEDEEEEGGGGEDIATLPSTQTRPAADVTMPLSNCHRPYHDRPQPLYLEYVTRAAHNLHHRRLQNPYRHRQLHLCNC